jgi:hypothetical protein
LLEYLLIILLATCCQQNVTWPVRWSLFHYIYWHLVMLYKI